MNRRCRFLIILPLLTLFLTACVENGEKRTANPATTNPSQDGTVTAESPAATDPSQAGVVETDSYSSVIFSAEQIAAAPYWPHNDDPWTPSETDVIAVEEQLSGYLQEEDPDLWQKLKSYTRQYWGTVTPNGNRAVYANFFCDADRVASYMDWRTEPVQVLDGGDCYFQTLYDVEDGIFVWLAINGEA